MVLYIRPQMNAETAFLFNSPVIDRIIRYVASRNRLSAEEAEEFYSFVNLRLIENDYALLGEFEEQSSSSRYLTATITGLFSSYRNDRSNKCRPSAEAKRLGDTAVRLEQLMTDAHTFAEAAQMLGHVATRGELNAIYQRLRNRAPRPTMLSFEEAMSGDEDDRSDRRLIENARIMVPDEVIDAEYQAYAVRAARILESVLARLTPADLAVIQLRFFDGLRVANIANLLGIEPKSLYKRIKKLLVILRRALEEQQINRETMAAILAAADRDAAAVPHVGPLVSAANRGAFIDVVTPRDTFRAALVQDSQSSDGRHSSSDTHPQLTT